MRHESQISNFLNILREELEHAGVVNAVIVVVPGMYVECVFGHGATGHVEHVRQPLADSRIQ